MTFLFLTSDILGMVTHESLFPFLLADIALNCGDRSLQTLKQSPSALQNSCGCLLSLGGVCIILAHLCRKFLHLPSCASRLGVQNRIVRQHFFPIFAKYRDWYLTGNQLQWPSRCRKYLVEPKTEHHRFFPIRASWRKKRTKEKLWQKFGNSFQLVLFYDRDSVDQSLSNFSLWWRNP
jgi:hypothetical protein